MKINEIQSRIDAPGTAWWASSVLEVRRQLLDNGLPVIALPRPGLHSVSIAFMVRGGPRFESPADNGLSHLLEHMLFRGTDGLPSSLSFNAAVEALGGEINGYTQRDVLCIHMTVPRESAASALALMAELCLRPRLTGLEIERHVVVEEIRDTQDTRGLETDIDSLSRAVLWPGHAMAQPITGSIEQVLAFTEADVRRFHRRLFGAKNAVLVVAGAMEAELVFEVSRREFGALPAGERLEALAPPEPILHAPIHLQRTEDAQVSIALSYPAPHELDPDFATLMLLQRVLDDGFASRLRRALVEESGLAYSASAGVDAYADLAALDLEATVSPPKVCRAVEALLETASQLAQAPISAAELARAQTRHRAELAFGLDAPSELASWFGATELIGCRSSYADRFGQGSGVRAEMILDLARRLFRPELAVLTLVGPVRSRDLRALSDRLGRTVRLFGAFPAGPRPKVLSGPPPEPPGLDEPIRAA